MSKFLDNLKRVWVETVVSIVLVAVLFMGLYSFLPNPLQLLVLKATYISVGILHAHLIGKLIIPTKVEWGFKIHNQSGAFCVRLALYVIVPLCYAMGA